MRGDGTVADRKNDKRKQIPLTVRPNAFARTERKAERAIREVREDAERHVEDSVERVEHSVEHFGEELHETVPPSAIPKANRIIAVLHHRLALHFRSTGHFAMRPELGTPDGALHRHGQQLWHRRHRLRLPRRTQLRRAHRPHLPQPEGQDIRGAHAPACARRPAFGRVAHERRPQWRRLARNHLRVPVHLCGRISDLQRPESRSCASVQESLQGWQGGAQEGLRARSGPSRLHPAQLLQSFLDLHDGKRAGPVHGNGLLPARQSRLGKPCGPAMGTVLADLRFSAPCS